MTESNQDNAHDTLSKEEYKLLSKAEKKELECSVQMSDEEIKEASEACENCCSYYHSVFKLYNLDREDVISDTFLKLVRFRHLFEGRSKWSTFVYRVASNSILNSIQSAKRQGDTYSIRKEYIEDGEGETNLNNIIGYEPADSTYDEILYEARKEKMYSLIEELPPKMKTILLMYLSGMKYIEISKEVGIALGSVQSGIHRAKAILTEMVDAKYEDYK